MLGLVAIVLAGGARAAALETPAGPVLLTVTGAVDRTNRGPFDETTDRFLAYHELTFQRAAAFDRAMLAALGMHTVRLAAQHGSGVQRVRGPRLSDVLAAVGARSGAVSVLALDGFRSEIADAGRAERPWILGLEVDGRLLGLGGLGPAWIVYAPAAADSRATHEETMQWPWAAFVLVVAAPE